MSTTEKQHYLCIGGGVFIGLLMGLAIGLLVNLNGLDKSLKNPHQQAQDSEQLSSVADDDFFTWR